MGEGGIPKFPEGATYRIPDEIWEVAVAAAQSSGEVGADRSPTDGTEGQAPMRTKPNLIHDVPKPGTSPVHYAGDPPQVERMDFPQVIISQTLATSRYPEAYHWVRKVATTDIQSLAYYNRNWMTMALVLELWEAMTPITKKKTYREQDAKRKQKLADWKNLKAKAVDYFKKNNINIKAADKMARTLIMRALMNHLTDLELPMTNEVLDSTPKAEGADDKDTMWNRAEHDERFTVPIDALLAATNGRLEGYFKDSKHGKRTGVAECYYRCGMYFWLTTAPKEKNVRAHQIQIGPFECGQMLSAQLGWNHRHKTTGTTRNSWFCCYCSSDWRKAPNGNYAVIIYDGETVIILILDHPPQKLRHEWIKNRIEYYQRHEPNEAPRSERPEVPKLGTIRQVQFEGEASDAIWKILYQDQDLAETKELREAAHKHHKETLVTSAGTGRWKTIEHTAEGAAALQKAMIQGPLGDTILDKKMVDPDNKGTWMKTQGTREREPDTVATDGTSTGASSSSQGPHTQNKVPPPPPMTEAMAAAARWKKALKQNITTYTTGQKHECYFCQKYTVAAEECTCLSKGGQWHNGHWLDDTTNNAPPSPPMPVNMDTHSVRTSKD